MFPPDDTSTASLRSRLGEPAQPGTSGYTTVFAGMLDPDAPPDSVDAFHERVLRGLKRL